MNAHTHIFVSVAEDLKSRCLTTCILIYLAKSLVLGVFQRNIYICKCIVFDAMESFHIFVLPGTGTITGTVAACTRG